MSKPDNFILNTEYATLKNNSNLVTCTIQIPATTLPGDGSSQVYTGIVTVGSPGAPMNWDINYSVSSDICKSYGLHFVENIGTPNRYQGQIDVFRNSATTAKVVVVIYRSESGSITKNARTVTVRIYTYLSPFN